jgi:tagatose-6-phosphate ketose/aldose isomerase
MMSEAGALRAFLDPLLERRDLRVILSGAGSSSFVGACLAPALKRRTRLRVDAVATTDLVGSPDSCLEPTVPTLLVSFARSGNSPESVAALSLAEQGMTDCHHLIVTCNREGDLYRQGQQQRNAHVVLLPQETNDRGFAMTSSFTGMMLAAALAFDLLPQDRSAALASWAAHVLEAGLPLAAHLARSGFERVVYLGSREFASLAREAALKMLELSDGHIVAVAETPMGFRHGPKTIVNGKTLVVMFLCNDRYTHRYEMDLLRELRADGVAARVVALYAAQAGAVPAAGIAVPGAAGASDLGLCFAYAMFAQTFAFLQSLNLGLRPDTPNARGVVNRVVQGVSIYPWNPPR